MINKEQFEKFALKIEEVFALLCVYICFMKILDWFKTLYVGDFNVFKSIISAIIATIVIIFFIVTGEKTLNIAKHFYTIFCCVCTYLHFDVLISSWIGWIYLLCAGGIVFHSIYNTINRAKFSESVNAENDWTDVFFFVALFIMSQIAFWLFTYIPSV